MPLLLFAIIFLWTPPHFWALALFVKTDYAKVGIPMMPVVARRERRRGARSSPIRCPVLPIAAAPWAIGGTGAIYGSPRVVLSLALRRASLAGRVAQDDGGRLDEARKAAVRLVDRLSVRAVRRAGGRPRRCQQWSVSHDARGRSGIQAPPQRRATWRLALMLLFFVDPVLRSSPSCRPAGMTMTAAIARLDNEPAHCADRAAAWRAGDARPRFCRGAALPACSAR